MKEKILTSLFLLVAGTLVNLHAQDVPQVTPPSDLRDDNIRRRSIDLERVKQDAAKLVASGRSVVRSGIEKRYPEIKKDFEGIQKSQVLIIAAYTRSKLINYGLIESSANRISKQANRLNSNLFKTEKKIKFAKLKNKKSKSVKKLIISLDNAIGAFTKSKMFKDLRVIEPDVAVKTQSDLARIMFLGNELANAAKRKR